MSWVCLLLLMPGVLFLVPVMPLPNCGMLEKECVGKPSLAMSRTSMPSAYVSTWTEGMGFKLIFLYFSGLSSKACSVWCSIMVYFLIVFVGGESTWKLKSCVFFPYLSLPHRSSSQMAMHLPQAQMMLRAGFLIFGLIRNLWFIHTIISSVASPL